MVYSQHDWSNAVLRLISATSKQQLNWAPTFDYHSNTNERVLRAFDSSHQQNRYVIKEIMRPVFLESDPEEPVWDGPFYSLELYRKVSVLQEQYVTTAPNATMIRDLFKKVESMYAFRMGILDDLLAPDAFE